jgi:hypothetical protein
MKRFARLGIFVLAACAARPVLAADDALIVAGAGIAGRWNTEFEIANVSTDPVDVTLSIGGLPLAVPCPPNCTTETYRVPGAGTIEVRADDFIGLFYVGPQLVTVEVGSGAPLPVVHARSFSSESACQFAELPVVRKSSIVAMDPPVLVFPGVTRGDGFYTNLILESLADTATAVEVELLDADGQRLGLAEFLVPGQITSTAFTLVDVAARFGVATIQNGQVRVRNLTATGPVWGVLATVGAEGSLQVAIGANP